ncbi:flagellar basal-body MS-ring/collar protein FliF, partial [Variovorax dokdonensis]
EIEQGYIRRIEAILQPILGASNVRAQVAADIDFSVSEHTDESYKPNQQPGTAAVRSQQSSESSQHGAVPPGGVPGALSNQPPVNPNAPIVNAPAGAQANTPAGAPGGANNNARGQQPAAAANAASTTTTSAPAGPGSARKDVTTNYELDRSIRHVQQSAGAVRRLSVAVVVNYRDDAQGGKSAARALTPAELDQVRNLVKEAMGFSQDRGDSLNVVNSPFAGDGRDAAEPDLPFWKDPANLPLAMQLGRYLLIGLGLMFLWFAVLRPLLRKHLGPPPAPAVAEPLESEADAAPAPVDEEPQISPSEALRAREAERQRADMDYARELANKDPKLVATLIQHWMNANDE